MMKDEIESTTKEQWEGKMPWNKKSFKKHNKGLSEGESEQASHVANAILDETGDEGKAVRIANWQAKKRRHAHAARKGKTRSAMGKLRRSDHFEEKDHG